MMELKGKRTLVIGLGKTGVAVSRFLALQGASVIACDDKASPELERAVAGLKDLDIDVTLGSTHVDFSKKTDLVVPSPGVPPAHHLLRDAIACRMPIISELELAFRHTNTPIIAVTGTNGKTTTTRLIGSILEHWGKKIFVGGNIGTPLIACAGSDSRFDFLVVEVSSFQLQWIETFRSRVAVLLNVAPDHLDYHGSFDQYRIAKERIFENQNKGDAAVINARYSGFASLASKIRGEINAFSSFGSVEKGMVLEDEELRFCCPEGNKEVYPIDRIRLKGIHNMENIMAATIAARHCGCPYGIIMETLESFPGLEHRMEYVGEKSGVQFYNDSKGTNVDAVARALESLPGRIILLMGGRNKRGDFAPLSKLVSKRVKELVLFGEARNEIEYALKGLVKTRIADRLGDAIEIAFCDSGRGDTVLLSPGCASFDEFLNYEERGRYFKKAVVDLSKIRNGNG